MPGKNWTMQTKSKKLSDFNLLNRQPSCRFFIDLYHHPTLVKFLSMRPFRIFLFLFPLVLQGITLHAQIDFKRYTTATDTFYWKRYQHVPKPERVNLKKFSPPGAKKLINLFLEKNLSQFPQFNNDSMPKYGLDALRKSLYPIDINADGRVDMIFSGFSGGEAEVTRIFLNRDGTDELLFEDYQYISRLSMAGGKLTGIQVGDPGCCDGYLYFTRDYTVNCDSAVPRFIKGKQTVIYCYTEEPSRYLEKPRSFKAAADTLMVRASALRLNEPFNPHLDTFGNIVAKYRTKAKGNILATKTPVKGNTWYFVEIFPDTTPSASILYDTEKIPTFLRGWVSGSGIVPNDQ